MPTHPFREQSLPKNDHSVAVVGGCGHVGLPLGLMLVDQNHDVTLIDTNLERVQEVRMGQMPFMEDGAEVPLRKALESGRLSITTKFGDPVPDVIIITVGTPVDEYMNPDVQPFDRLFDELIPQLRNGQLLIMRSTLFPGTTERLGKRLKKAGLDLDVAYCPERIAQGHALKELARLPQLISGLSDSAENRAARLFSQFGAQTIRLPPIEAELSKLFANAYRYINFAISNQFYTIAERFGADFHRIHAAVTEDYPRMVGFARAGLAAGPCLLKDTMQLAAFNHNSFVLGQAAMMVNEGLPTVLVERAAQQHDLSQMTAAILGMTFKGNSDDIRDSLAFKLRKLLALSCRRVICTDEYHKDPTFVSLETALTEADILFVGACHERYRNLKISIPLVDPFGFMGGINA